MDFNEQLLANIQLSTDSIMGKATREQFQENLCFIWSYVFKKVYGGEFVSLVVKNGEDFFDPENMWEHSFIKLNGSGIANET